MRTYLAIAAVGVAICSWFLMVGIYYMKVFARSAAFLTPELIRTAVQLALECCAARAPDEEQFRVLGS
jgi:hypothetical protein